MIRSLYFSFVRKLVLQILNEIEILFNSGHVKLMGHGDSWGLMGTNNILPLAINGNK